MAENSKIEWTTHTFNPWRGCTKIAPGCANCYADAMSKRNPKTLGVWGPNGTRVVASESMWREPLKWDRLAKEAGERHRVFCASLADVFEDWDGRVSDSRSLAGFRFIKDGEWGWGLDGPRDKWNDNTTNAIPLTLNDVRRRLFNLIDATPNLDWLLVTKRPENVRRMWPSADVFDSESEHKAYWSNVWLLTSISDQATADAMIPHLLACRDLVPVLGLSCEPLLGPVDLSYRGLPIECPECGGSGELDDSHPSHGKQTESDSDGEPLDNCLECNGDFNGVIQDIDWVIVGGESGHGARPYDLAWARSIIGQCKAAGVPVFHKQIGAITVDSAFPEKDGTPSILLGIKDPKGGDMSEWPEDLRVREYPKAVAS